MSSGQKEEPCCNKTQKMEKDFCVNEERKRLGLPQLLEKEANMMLTPINE